MLGESACFDSLPAVPLPTVLLTIVYPTEAHPDGSIGDE